MRGPAWRLGALLLLGAGNVMAGAYVFADQDDPDSVTHIRGYTSNFAGGALPSISVCVDNSVNPALAAQAEPSVRKVVATLNRLRSIRDNTLAFNAATDIPSGRFDFESAVLHEVGHCIGLAHPNHASEGGLGGDASEGTKSGPGANTSLDQATGPDALHGSRDDVRSDDVNLHWYLRNVNDPGQLPAAFDSTTMAVTLNFLPNGHSFAANAERKVMAALSYPNTEAVMQQGAGGREAQRHLTADDEATLRLARSGRDRLQGTADDYTWQLNYIGQLNNPSDADCNIRVRVDDSTGFAVCALGGAFLTGGDLRVTSARAAFNASTNWYFSPSENTEVELTSDVATAVVNQAFTVRVRVREVAGISITGEPRGSVEITDDVAAPNTGRCTIALTGSVNEQGSCAFTSRSTGTRTLRAQFLGYGGWDASLGSMMIPVNAAGATASTTTVTAATPSPSVVGQPYRVDVTVSSSGGTPSGSVTVADGAGATCSIAALSGGSGNCNLTSTSAGARTLVAMYGGGGSIGGSQGSRAHTVSPAATSASISTSTPEPSALNQQVQVAFAVAVQSPGAGTPAGNVTVTAQNGGENCTATVAAGSCLLTLTNAGSRNLVAAYAGNANFAASQSAARVHRVRAPSNVQITGRTPASTVVGQAYSVNVGVSGASGVPTGQVNISDDAGAACVATVQGDGSAQCVLRSRSAGSRQISAAYAGDAVYSPGTAGAMHSVGQATTAVSVLGATPQPSQEGQSVQVSYSVAAQAPGEGPVIGTVQVVAAAGGEQCSGTVAAGSCSIVLNAMGERSLSVLYLGNADFLPSSTLTTQTVVSPLPGRIFRSGFEDANL